MICDICKAVCIDEAEAQMTTVICPGCHGEIHVCSDCKVEFCPHCDYAY